MFEFQQPIQHDVKPNWAHMVIAGAGLSLVLILTAYAPPGAVEKFGFLRRSVVLEWAPSILMLAAIRARASTPGTAAALAFTFGGAIWTEVTGNRVPMIAGAVVGTWLLLSIKVADQWEKCVVLRFGRYHSLRGPGMFRILPIVDRVAAFVDERVRTTAVQAEAALTSDAVPVHVDAVIFWEVWDVKKAVLEVQDFDRIVGLTAQTALLESIGRHALSDMIGERAQLGRDLKGILEEKTTPWGVTLQSVEIRDVRLPATLQDVMSRQAQAERERQARIIFGDTEEQLAGRFAQASVAYMGDPTALHLRAMNMLFEAIKENGRMVVVPTGGLTRRTGRGALRRRMESREGRR